MKISSPCSLLSSEVGLVEDKKCLLCGLRVAAGTVPRGGAGGVALCGLVSLEQLGSTQPPRSVTYFVPGTVLGTGKPDPRPGWASGGDTEAGLACSQSTSIWHICQHLSHVSRWGPYVLLKMLNITLHVGNAHVLLVSGTQWKRGAC